MVCGIVLGDVFLCPPDGKGDRNSSDTHITDNNLCLWLGHSGLCSFRGAGPHVPMLLPGFTGGIH